MRALWIWPLLCFGFGCRPDPLAAALSVPAPRAAAARAATIGDTVRIEMLRPPVRATATVDDRGMIAAPLCGEVRVSGLQAPALCVAVAECLGTMIRRAAVRVSIGEAPNEAQQAGCDFEGEALPESPAPVSQRVLAKVAHAAATDPVVLGRAIEAAATLEALRVERTDAHPEVVAMNHRIEALMEAAEIAATPERSLRALIEAEVDDAAQSLATLDGALGPSHPDRIVAAARHDFLVTARQALLEQSAPMRAAEHGVAMVEVRARIAYWERHVGPRHAELLALRERAATLASAKPAPSPCAQRRNALDLRIAFLRGVHSASDDNALRDLVLDALAVARAKLRDDPVCRSPSLTDVAPSAPPP
ncbi:MAG: polysaccharide biosynthesis/export family protein [Myxococcota bacterium]